MKFLSGLMLEALRFFSVFGGYGWGIVWLTIAVNLALYPLTLSSIQSMSAMQKMQPKLQDLQKKLKDKPQEIQKATMELYRSEGVNPLGGCLPVLLKIPFFLALFWAFYSAAFLGIASDPANNTSFLWVSGRVTASAFESPSLVRRLVDSKMLVVDKEETQRKGREIFVWNAVLESGETSLNDILKGARADKATDVKAEDLEKVKKGLAPLLPDLSDEEAKSIILAWNNTNSLGKPERINTPFGRISLLALLIGITTFLMQKTMPGAGGQQAQLMGLFMPVFITFICWNFPAGVQLYWLVSNAVGALQQYLIMRAPKRRARKKGAK